MRNQLLCVGKPSAILCFSVHAMYAKGGSYRSCLILIMEHSYFGTFVTLFQDSGWRKEKKQKKSSHALKLRSCKGKKNGCDIFTGTENINAHLSVPVMCQAVLKPLEDSTKTHCCEKRLLVLIFLDKKLFLLFCFFPGSNHTW